MSLAVCPMDGQQLSQVRREMVGKDPRKNKAVALSLTLLWRRHFRQICSAARNRTTVCVDRRSLENLDQCEEGQQDTLGKRLAAILAGRSAPNSATERPLTPAANSDPVLYEGGELNYA